MFTPCNTSHVKFHMSHVMCHMSHVMCHMSHVMCHMSHIYLSIFFGQSGEAYRWRVCYRRVTVRTSPFIMPPSSKCCLIQNVAHCFHEVSCKKSKHRPPCHNVALYLTQLKSSDNLNVFVLFFI